MMPQGKNIYALVHLRGYAIRTKINWFYSYVKSIAGASSVLIALEQDIRPIWEIIAKSLTVLKNESLHHPNPTNLDNTPTTMERQI